MPFKKRTSRPMAAPFAASLVAAGLIAALPARADPPAATDGSAPPHAWRGHKHDPAMMQRHLDRLKADLKLQANQEGAWTAFTTALKAQRDRMHDRFEKARATLDTPASLPERLDRRAAAMKQQQADMEETYAAIKQFYSLLTPEQRAVMDKQFMPRFRHPPKV